MTEKRNPLPNDGCHVPTDLTAHPHGAAELGFAQLPQQVEEMGSMLLPIMPAGNQELLTTGYALV